MTSPGFTPEAGMDAKQVNIAGNNHGPVHITEHRTVHIVGDPQLNIDARSAVSISLSGGSKDSGYVHAAPAPVSVDAPYGRLPRSIVGRDDILDAIACGEASDSRRIHVLAGMGGVGKTTVALYVAEQAKRSGAVVYWVAAGSASAVSDGMRQVALLTGAASDSVAHAWEGGGRAAADLVWRALEVQHRPWILIFDDADDLDVLSCPGAALADSTGWVRPPVGHALSILVTTRDGNARSWGDRIAYIHRLQVLESRFATQVLQNLAPADAGNFIEAQALAEQLGRLPLALHLVGNYLAEAHNDPLAQARTFAQYTNVLEGSPLTLDEPIGETYGDLRSAEDHARTTIAGTWELSLDLLEYQGIRHARDMLRLLACFAPATPLPSVLINTEAVAALEMWASDLSEPTARATIRGLHRFGLVDVDTSADQPVYRIHRLVAEVSVTPLLANPETYQKIWHGAADLLTAATPHTESPRNPDTWPAWQSLTPHWQAFVNRGSSWSTIAGSRLDAVLLCAGVAVSYLHFRSDYDGACELADNSLDQWSQIDVDPSITANIRRHRTIAVMEKGDLTTAETDFNAIIADCITKLGATHPMTVSARYDRARVLTLRGKNVEAEREYDDVIDHETSLYGPEAVATLLTRHARAICIRASGRIVEAAEQGQLVLAGLRKLLGEAHPDVLHARHEYAVSLRDHGNYETAADLFNQVLQLEIVSLGAEHPSTLITLSNLAVTRMLCGDYSAGEAMIREVLEARTRILGPHHHETLDAQGSLAVILVGKGELDARSAEVAFGQLTNGYQTQVIDDHPQVLAIRGSRAAALRLLGERIDAEVECCAILQAATSRHGHDHPITLNAHYEWAISLGELDRTNEAIAQMRDILPRMESVLGSSHNKVISAWQALGALQLKHGLLADAEDTFRRTLNRLAEGGKARHDVQHDLAAVLLARGQLREAISQFRILLVEQESRYSASHPDTLLIRNNLGIALKEFGELDEAAAMYRTALKHARATSNYNTDQPLILTLRHSLAVVLRAQGQLDDSEAELSEILSIQERKYGPEHSETLTTRKSLARVLDEKGSKAQAEAEYREIRDTYRKSRGENHPYTLYVQGNLAYFLLTQGRFAESESEYKDALDRCLNTFGASHPETLRMDHNLALTLAPQGKLPEAVTRLSNVVERRRNTLGDDHNDTLIARTNLAHAFYQARQPTESAEQFRLIAEAKTTASSAADDEVWDARARRAQLLWEAGKSLQAQREFESLIESASGARSKDDQRVVAALRVLEFVRADAEWHAGE